MRLGTHSDMFSIRYHYACHLDNLRLEPKTKQDMKTPKSLLAIDQLLKESPTTLLDDEFTAEMYAQRAAEIGEPVTIAKVRCSLDRKVASGILKKRKVLINAHYTNAYSLVAKDA